MSRRVIERVVQEVEPDVASAEGHTPSLLADTPEAAVRSLRMTQDEEHMMRTPSRCTW
jgi:hypothetical protein